MKKLSLQIRLILSFIFIASAVWTASAIASWYESREQLDEFFDTYQTLLARQLSTADWNSLDSDSQKNINKIIDNLDNDGEEEDEALGFAVFNHNGQMIFNDDQNGANFRYTSQASGFMNQSIGKKHKIWRIIWLKTADHKFTIAVGQELEFRNEAAFDLVEETMLPWLIGLSILMLATIWLVYNQFKPLKKIAQSLSQRHSDDLSSLDASKLSSEIAPLVQALNQLFEQISQMLKKERSFISDSAHELRSPLTALKVQLEVAQLAEDDPQTRKEALNKLNTGIERASRLVEQLLALSRLETINNLTQFEKATLNWNDLIQDSITEQLSIAKKANITINFSSDDQAPIFEGFPLLWSLLLRNLIDNALRYSPQGAVVSIKISNHCLSIENSGIMVEQKHLSRLQERFFRPPGQVQSGSGLGLSIVERISTLHNCQTKFENTKNGFMVSIFPL